MSIPKMKFIPASDRKTEIRLEAIAREKLERMNRKIYATLSPRERELLEDYNAKRAPEDMARELAILREEAEVTQRQLNAKARFNHFKNWEYECNKADWYRKNAKDQHMGKFALSGLVNKKELDSSQVLAVSIDLGLNGSGVAHWNYKGRLLHAFYAKVRKIHRQNYNRYVAPVKAIEYPYGDPGVMNPKGTFNWPLMSASLFVIEAPKIYPERLQKGDPQDIIDLAKVVGAFHFAYDNCPGTNRVHDVQPYVWKGSIDKKVTERRVKKRLTERELECVELPSADSLDHNVWDAIGIGLYAFTDRWFK